MLYSHSWTAEPSHSSSALSSPLAACNEDLAIHAGSPVGSAAHIHQATCVKNVSPHRFLSCRHSVQTTTIPSSHKKKSFSPRHFRFPTGLQCPPSALPILAPSQSVPFATAPIKTYLLPPPAAGVQREKEVMLLQYNSPGVHSNGGNGGSDGPRSPSSPFIVALDRVEG